MTKAELANRTDAAWKQTHDALQLVWDATNKGQRQKLLRNEEIKAMQQKLLRNEEIKAMMERHRIVTEDEA